MLNRRQSRDEHYPRQLYPEAEPGPWYAIRPTMAVSARLRLFRHGMGVLLSSIAHHLSGRGSGMFTGLIECPGKVLATTAQGRDATRETRLEISPACPMDRFVRGESIAVNGVCLTVETFSEDRFSVYASAETMQLTNLGRLKAGSLVNLERALALCDRLGGHLVSGHVDCLAQVSEMRNAGQSRCFRLVYPLEFSQLVVSKGSVTLDGVSLTVNGCGRGWLEVNIIPETMRNTTLFQWRIGNHVNMETDLIGKYVQKMVGPWTETHSPGGISEAFLREHGF